MTNDAIGGKIKTLRNGRKMTQQDVADVLGVNRTTISNYEIGRRVPSLTELKKIAAMFGVGLDFFGVATKDEIFDLLSRARDVFNDDQIPKTEKEKVYKELMKLYLSLEE